MTVYNYAVRITHSFEACKALVDTWSYRCQKMLVYEHTGSVTEKVHIHLVIEEADTGKKWLRELGTRHGINLKGNKFCSFKEFDGDKTAMVYMTKGIHDPKFVKGYTAEDIALWKSQWVSHPKSRDEMIYQQLFGSDEYNNEVYDNWTILHPPVDNDIFHRFKWVKATAWQYVLGRNGYIVNLKTINEYKMLVYSHCAKTNVVMPDNDKTFQRHGL